MVFEFKLPDIAEGVHEGEIVAWHVKPGQAVKEDQGTVAESRSAPLRASPQEVTCWTVGA